MMGARIDCKHAHYVSWGVGSQVQETEHYECSAKGDIPITEPPFGSFFIHVPYAQGGVVAYEYVEEGWFIFKKRAVIPVFQKIHPCDGCPLYKPRQRMEEKPQCSI